MGNAILFAATNQYLNGQTVVVDGGYMLDLLLSHDDFMNSND
jgi:hypothetical protein